MIDPSFNPNQISLPLFVVEKSSSKCGGEFSITTRIGSAKALACSTWTLVAVGEVGGAVGGIEVGVGEIGAVVCDGLGTESVGCTGVTVGNGWDAGTLKTLQATRINRTNTIIGRRLLWFIFYNTFLAPGALPGSCQGVRTMTFPTDWQLNGHNR